MTTQEFNALADAVAVTVEDPAVDGSMQPYALTLDKFLTHAARWPMPSCDRGH